MLPYQLYVQERHPDRVRFDAYERLIHYSRAEEAFRHYRIVEAAIGRDFDLVVVLASRISR